MAGTIIQGTPYVAVYNNTDGAFYLQGSYGNPYNVPLAAGMDYWAGVAPNSAFAFPFGQAISRTTYATLYALIGGQYGGGDGSTTFNLPDVRGRVRAAVDNLGGTTANRLIDSPSMAGNRHSLGGAGGTDTHSLIVNEIPPIASTGENAISVNSNVGGVPSGAQSYVGLPTNGGAQGIIGPGGAQINCGVLASSGNNNISVTTNGTNGATHENVQPTILCAYIMPIL
jgi:microcystin-dependent protein